MLPAVSLGQRLNSPEIKSEVEIKADSEYPWYAGLAPVSAINTKPFSDTADISGI